MDPDTSSRVCRTPAPCSSISARTSATSPRGTVPPSGVRSEVHQPQARRVQQPARPDDRPVQVARPQVVLGLRLRVQVRHPGRVRPGAAGHRRRSTRPARTAAPRPARQRRPTAPSRRIHRVLPLGRAAPAGAGREHHRVGAADHLGQRLGGGALQVEDHRFGPGRHQIVGAVGAPQQPLHRVTVRAQARLQQQSDLSMAARNHDLRHASSLPTRGAWEVEATVGPENPDRQHL